MSQLKIAFQLPFGVLVKRIIRRLLPAKKNNYHLKEWRGVAEEKLSPVVEFKKNQIVVNQFFVKNYLNHQFKIFDKDWKDRNASQKPILNWAHQAFSEKIIAHVSSNYQFINWQLDVKSGFEFDVTKPFYQQVAYKEKRIDVKNCWELGRLQHLPQLALAAQEAENKAEIIQEFKNQCLDFIANNPVGMGCQWMCAMDVGIRVSNLLVAYDIFKQVDEFGILDETFDTFFVDNVYQHGLFIYNHIEHKEGAAGNHYLFNLVGLLFVAAYLSQNKEVQQWGDFAANEIQKELEKQFFNDGGNFEGSTTYHCLSTEAMLYATAILLRRGVTFSEEYTNRLYRAGCFIKDVMKPNGNLPQFGDNDSGRLFILRHSDNYRNQDDKEGLLNYESLLAGFAGLFENTFDEFAIKHPLNKEFIEQLANYTKCILPTMNHQPSTDNHQPSTNNHQPNTEKTTLKFPVNIDTTLIQHYAYPDFGIYVFKSTSFYLAISAIANKKMHHSWGHAHNDKLSFELQVNNEDIVRDPGTYTYSADPTLRNEFRSTKAHHGIIVDGVEQNKIIDLFYMDREVRCSVLEVGLNKITLKANYYGVEHVRKFEILTDSLLVTDYCNQLFKVNINQFNKYSPMYGVIETMKS
ncbi:MAG: alginate lyase family protein [Vicingus serpentipes]|nr:alginate lyase family protein [Vicingus serpentipes]